ncbi:MAG: hypothetical protein ACRYGI_08685 [Janthinobacterium lividum]
MNIDFSRISDPVGPREVWELAEAGAWKDPFRSGRSEHVQSSPVRPLLEPPGYMGATHAGQEVLLDAVDRLMLCGLPFQVANAP